MLTFLFDVNPERRGLDFEVDVWRWLAGQIFRLRLSCDFCTVVVSLSGAELPLLINKRLVGDRLEESRLR